MIKLKSQAILAIMGSSFIVQCGKTPSVHAPVTSEIGAGSRSDQAILGQGYNVESEEFRGDCVKGKVDTTGTQQALLGWSQVSSEGEVSNALGFNVGGRARYGMVSGSASARFASNSQSSKYSEVIIYKNEMQFGNHKLVEIEPTTNGKTHLAADGRTILNKEEFTKGCGHEYVQQVTLGAALYLSVRLEFESEDAKTEFNFKARVKNNTGELSTDLDNASKSFSKQATVTISMFQLGGNVERLATALKDALVDVKNPNGGVGTAHGLTVCSMQRMDACTKVITAFLNYGTHDFPSQLKRDDTTRNAAGPAVLKYITKEYITAGIRGPNPAVEAGVTEARAQLAGRFEEQLVHRSRVNGLKSGEIRLAPSQKKEIDILDQNVAANINVLTHAGNICYTKLEECTAKSVEALKELKPMDDEVLKKVRLETYAQYCDLAKLPAQLVSLVATVDRLNQIAKRSLTGAPDNANIDWCQRYEDVLTQKKLIHLAGPSISNLEPLKSLPKLESLVLGRTNVSDISPLFSLTHLEHLTIRETFSFSRFEDVAKIPNIQLFGIDFLEGFGPYGTLTHPAVEVLKAKPSLLEFISGDTGCKRETSSEEWKCGILSQI